MSSFDTRHSTPSDRRLQAILLLFILWDVIALIAELSFGGPLLKISGDKIGGFLAARGSFDGGAIIPLAIYVYAFVRGPVRHRNLLWVGVLEQGAAALFAIYHVATGDIKVEGIILPMVVSLALLVLLLVNMPRTSQAPA